MLHTQPFKKEDITAKTTITMTINTIIIMTINTINQTKATVPRKKNGDFSYNNSESGTK